MNKILYTAMLFMALYSGRAFAQQKSTEVEKMATRFIDYASIGSQSVDTTPGLFYVTPQQKTMAWKVYNDIRAKGVEYVYIDTNHFFVYAKVAGTRKESPSICFASHLDITPEVVGPNAGIPVRPTIHRNYDGNAIVLQDGVVLSPDSPEGKYLKDCMGKTLVSSTGRTLLGGDNKAGVSICVSIIERLVTDDSPRPDVYFIFSQNEEVGLAAQGLNIEEYLDAVPDMFVDIDGADPGEVNSESFCAVQRKYRFCGNWAHTSNGRNYADAATAMAYFIGCLPPQIHPSHSTGRQGYVHCYDLKKVGNDWVLSFRIRYFEKSDSLMFEQYFSDAMRRTSQAYPLVKVKMDTNYIAYDNIANHMYPGTVECIMRAAENLGIPMRCTSLRAGTTSALMSAVGLPSGPCMFSGVYNEHTKFEYVCIDQLVEITDLCQEIIREVAKLKK